MKLSPLQLEAYFLTDLTFRANQEFNPAKEPTFQESDLVVLPEVQPVKDQPRRWQITLNLKLQPKPEANSPYYFTLTLVGIVWAAANLPEDKLNTLVYTNGSTMLYGVAREMARDLTARGPFPPISLPSVSFIPESSAPQPPQTEKPSIPETPKPAPQAP